jgi:DNA polymerase-3 subunit alpha
MRSLEDLGLLKMDFLGLENLTLIEETLKKIWAIHKKEIDIQNLPLDDKKTFKLFQKGQTIGVFQFESEGMRKWLRKLKPNCFEDLVAMIALYRPGPMQFIDSYIKRKYGKEKIKYLHPKLESILKETYGIPIYQEQIMKIAQELAGFTLGEADLLRKAIGKKIKSLLDKLKDKLIKGMEKNGISKNVAEKIWHWILPFGSYGFNKSHSVAYAIIAYQTAFLKAHFPVEFMASLLSTKKADVERIGFLIEECKRMGIEVLPPDINESFREFSVVPGKNQIRFGLLSIKNVGHNTVEAIIKERKENGKFSSLTDFLSRIDPKDLNKKTLESMIKAGVFDKFGERKQLLFNLERLLEWNRENYKMKLQKQMGLFTNFGQKGQIKLEKIKPATKKERLIWEKELLGLYVSSHPALDFQSIFEKRTIPLSKITNEMAGKIVKVGGIISAIKKIITRNGSPMFFTKIEDGKSQIEVVVFPSVLMKNPNAFKEHKAVLVSGRVDDKDGIPKIIAEDVEEILEE